MKHTPGPWRVVQQNCDLDNDTDIRGPINPDKSSIYIATMSGCDETPANACLIAAAPEMLAELEHVHDMLRHYLKCGYLPHMSAEEAEQVVRNPSSAIRKAKGGL